MIRGKAESDRLDADGDAKPTTREIPYLDFFVRVTRAMSYSEMKAVQIIMMPQENDAVDLKWAAWWLEKARKTRWAPTKDVNVHGPNDGPIKIEAKVEDDPFKHLTAGERERIIEILIDAENRRISEGNADESALLLSQSGMAEDRPESVYGQLAHPTDSGIPSDGDLRQDPEADN